MNDEVESVVQDEQEDNTKQQIRDAFDEAVGAEKSEDDVKMAMIGAGATFKNVTRLYNEFMIDAGLAISREDRNAAVEGALSGMDLSTEEGYDEAVAAVIDAVKGANERSAAALVRGYAKKNELEIFKKPKSEGAGRQGFASQFYGWLVEGGATASEKEANDYIMNPANSQNVHRHLSHYMGIYKLCNAIATK